MAPSYSTQQKNHVKLSDAEIDELVDDWTPEPLVASQSILDQRVTQTAPVIAGPSGPKSKLTTGKTVTNLGSFNFYNLNANEVIKEKAIEVLRAYGVGPCGPPQFYGTQDVHVKTEADIAAYIASESISQIKSNPDLIAECRKNIRIIRAQIEGRNEYVTCTSNIENPVILIIFKPEVVRNRHLSEDEQERLLQAVVEEPALKVCTTIGLDKKEVEAAGQVIQSAIVKVMNRDSLMP
ncbi:Serine palmitoyltransferase 1 [Ceratocystis platani]|uniref:Serine palmitoyltransferase 1 n=1 Tax=Ceratocystis fimbriata f. sp. platani TaxID=88771 RepID=A0A0F8AZJ2_CERFI|nr:Serine palmitoyltransferase 1 [Ceratocystis platani]